MNVLRLSALIVAAVFLTSCDDGNHPADEKDTAAQHAALELPDSSGFASHLGLSAYTDMSMAAQRAQELDAKLAAFLYSPNATTLNAARESWRSAYDAYLHTLAYSKLPLNDPAEWSKQGIDYQQTLTALDSWPVEGGYIDYVEGYPFSGIVNDLTLALNEESLLAQNGFSDPTSVSIGYHAIEFMLWGSDGQRSAKDFLPKENTAPILDNTEAVNTDGTGDDATMQPEIASSTDVQNHTRRRQYLQLLSDGLQKHLHRLQRRWEPSNGYYSTLLTRSEPDNVLRASLIATQRIVSDELLNKRLTANSSEFSDTGLQDAAAILQGVRNVFLPQSDHEQLSGLASTLKEDDIELIKEWQKQLDAIQTSLNKLQENSKNTAAKEDSRQELTEFLTLIQNTARALNVRLPNATSAGKND